MFVFMEKILEPNPSVEHFLSLSVSDFHLRSKIKPYQLLRCNSSIDYHHHASTCCFNDAHSHGETLNHPIIDTQWLFPLLNQQKIILEHRERKGESTIKYSSCNENYGRNKWNFFRFFFHLETQFKISIEQLF